MEARVMPIGEIFLEGKRYYIPPYQRPYKWDVEEAEQLVQDIYESCENGHEEYFIGSVICIQKQDNRFEVVDGQQRLVTLTLIMLQLKKIIANEGIKNDLNKKIVQASDYEDNEDCPPVLMVRKSELEFYSALLRQEEDIPAKTDIQKRFMNNLKKIGDVMAQMEQGDLKKLAKYLLRHVFVVFVAVDNRASSFRLFNVLNDRGIPLSDADLVKNVLLEKAADDKEHSERVESRWEAIEDFVGEENVNNFLSLHKISEKKDRDRAQKKNFEYYEKRLKEEFQDNSVKMSKMLSRSAEFYYEIMEENKEAKKTISFLKALSKPDEWMPAFMAFLGNIKHENFPQFAKLFEKVYMHGVLADVSASTRKGICYYAVEAINTGKSFDEIMTCIRDLADNQKLEESLDNKQFYDGSRPMVINLVKSVLLRLESERHDDSMENTPDLRKITVEHILPQNMEDQYWIDRFTPDEHNEWLHKLGNLTLVSRAKNSAAKNSGFDEKKEAYKRLKQESPFQMTKEICDLPEWNMERLQNRHEKFKDQVKDLWLVKKPL